MNSEIARLHALYLSGKRSPVEVLEYHLAAARDLGGRLNAFTHLAEQRARIEAAASAERYSRGDPRSVLDGVPVSVKDLMHMRGEPTTCGSNAADRTPAHADAAVVARLTALGAVVYAKTNLLEYANGIVHPDFGPAHNPWDPARSSCGSSSGSAAAVAAGLGYASIGTDTAGSVRCPASWCGTVGLKPTFGVLPMEGVVPLSPSLDHVGVLARNVEDTRLVFESLTGRPRRSAGGRPLRLGMMRLPGARPDVLKAVDNTMARLRAEGIEVVDVDPLPWETGDAAAFALIYAEALEVHSGRLAERWHGYSEAGRARLVAGAVVSGADYVRAKRLQGELRDMWHQTLTREAVDAVASPTMPTVAPLEDEPTDDLTGGDLASFTSAYALIGVPAVTVPAGFGEHGMPVGLQLAAGHGQDSVVLEVAARVEAALGTWPAPPLFADPFGQGGA